MTDLRESGDLENTANSVIGLYREEMDQRRAQVEKLARGAVTSGSFIEAPTAQAAQTAAPRTSSASVRSSARATRRFMLLIRVDSIDFRG